MDKKIFLYILIGLIIFGILIMTFFPNIVYAFRDAGKTGNSICNPPTGTSLEQWKEHMSHHPDIYRECLT